MRYLTIWLSANSLELPWVNVKSAAADSRISGTTAERNRLSQHYNSNDGTRNDNANVTNDFDNSNTRDGYDDRNDGIHADRDILWQSCSEPQV